MDAEIPRKRSYLRKDIEKALSEIGINLDQNIILLNLDTDEVFHFDDYYEAIEFTKGKKYRWYLTTTGITNY
ncbi:MAG: hypothetical protein LUQ47_04165 [Methanotrichaceae archaeon]|nr:hypothetical protein [Methanotrichaceae archaeon]